MALDVILAEDDALRVLFRERRILDGRERRIVDDDPSRKLRRRIGVDGLVRHLIVRRHGDDVLGRVVRDLRYAIDDELHQIWEDGGERCKRGPIL